jgi:hypothetical protein
MKCKCTYLLLVTFFSFLGGFTQRIQAQSPKLKEVPYLLKSGIAGETRYQFAVSGKDTIFQGPFSFRSTSLDAEGDNLFLSLQYQGNFKNGLNDGAWSYSFKELRPLRDFFEDDNKITFKSRGTERLVKAEFALGKASGCWEWLEQDIDLSSATGTSSRMLASFSQGVLLGDIEGDINGHHLSGKAVDGGFADGTWVINYPEKNNIIMQEVRQFQRGELVAHYLTSGKYMLHYRYGGLEVQDEWVEVPLDVYLMVLSRAVLNSAYGEFSELASQTFQQSNRLWNDALDGFLNHRGERIWEQIPGAEEPSMPKFKLPKIPAPSTRELSNSADIKKMIAEIQKDLDDLLNDSEIEINRYINSKVALYVEALKEHQKVLKRYERLLKDLSDPSFELIRKSDFFPPAISVIQYPNRVAFEVEGLKYEESFPFPQLKSIEYEELVHLKAYVKEIQAAVKDLEVAIDNALEVKQKEKRLQEKEQVLIKQRDEVMALFSNAAEREDYNIYHRSIESAVGAEVKKAFKAYAALDNFEKLERIDDLQQCMEDFIRLYEIQSAIPAQLDRIKEVYTRIVFNPYTMIDMEERVKERVYNAFQNYLLPYYLFDIQSSLTCELLGPKLKNFESMYRVMISIREQDTRELEKELRRVSSGERIIQLLQIEWN